MSSRLVLFIISSNDPERVAEVSKEFYMKIYVEISRDILGHEVNILEQPYVVDALSYTDHLAVLWVPI